MCSMKIISWNVRGLGSREKRRSIKEVVIREKPDIVILQETKKEEISWEVVGAVWGVRFKDWAFIPSEGSSGGVLIIWDVRVVTCEECVKGAFTVSIKLKPKQGESWWLTGVYGPCRYRERDSFWEELASLYGLCGNRWCLGGDFNIIRFPSEKKGGENGRWSRSMKKFDGFIRDSGLGDPGINNASYTWSNGRAHSRLDRFLFSANWDAFELVRQEVLVRVVSDHFPLVLDTSPFRWGPSPFRFENMWLSDREFLGKFKEWWEGSSASGWEGYKFMKRLEQVKCKVKKWNSEVFGDVRVKKGLILKSIQEIDEEEARIPLGEDKVVERRKLKEELDEILLKEEISWNQKAKVNGVIEWDANSKLFHRIVNQKKVNKFICKLEKEDGLVVTEESEIESELVSFFKKLYTRKGRDHVGFEDLDWDPITAESREWLERPFEEEEIKAAIDSCEGNKAPGPDGYTLEVFKKGWEVIKEDVTKVLREFYENGVVNACTNSTYICLIPKKNASLKLKDFRPISLVTSLYKILAKVLSLRLREVLGETVGAAQGAFVKGRQILDLVLIANEGVEEYREKRKEGVVLKIDFEKAYDHVKWDFVDHVLDKKGFGSKWRKWIKGCLSSVNFSVMMNGKPRGNFKATRGLRQGDPLSPFIFVLVADALNRLVERAKDRGLIEGFSIGRDCVSLSHLQFADDTIFFLAKDEEKIENLRGILDIFGYASGLKINFSKSEVVGINVVEEEMISIANRFGCVVGEWPLSYLGLPLGGNPKRVGFWSPVIEKIGKRLEGWVKGCLSRGGKLTLIHSVLESIPIYYLSLFKIPIAVAKVIEKLMRNFLWEGFEKGKGDHLVSWEKVSKSKKVGGLGIGNIVIRNEALLGKWLWRFPLEQNAFWHSIIKSKYGFQNNGWDSNVVVRGSYRNPWKAISLGIGKFVSYIRYKVGNGVKIRFWEDCWVGDFPLAVRFPRLHRLAIHPGSFIDSNLSWGANSSYSWNIVFRRNFNENEVNEFLELMEQISHWKISSLERDSRIWLGEKSGVFSSKSYFDTLSSSNDDSRFSPHNMVWKSGIPPKVRVLAWLSALRKVNTYDMLQIRKPFLQISPAWCIMCKREGESIDHLLIHCSFAHAIWCNIRNELGLVAVFPSSWYGLLSSTWRLKGNQKKSKIIWRCCCMAVIWCLWMERNARTFEDKEKSVEEIWHRIKALASLWAFSSKAFGSCSISDISRNWAAAVI